MALNFRVELLQKSLIWFGTAAGPQLAPEQVTAVMPEHAHTRAAGSRWPSFPTRSCACWVVPSHDYHFDWTSAAPGFLYGVPVM